MAYTYNRSITIDHTKVPNTDQSDFPVLFAGTYSWLATVANSGHVQNSSGYDIVFSSDAAGTSLLSFERVSYNASTGAVEFWVKIPTASYSSDTVIYVLYGDSGVSTDQQSASSVWDTNFSGVWHLGDGTTLGLTDSTSNANNGSNFGVTATSGQVGGGALFGSSAHISAGNGSTLQMSNTSNWTIEAWVNPSSLPSLTDILRYDDAGGSSPLYMVRANSSKIEFTFGSRTATLGSLTTVATISTSTWAHIVAVRTAGSSLKIYINGTQSATGADASTGTWTCNNFQLYFGLYNGTPNEAWTGKLDEIRVSHSARSADWIAAEYNNQNSPSAFYALGSEVGGAAVAAQPCFFILV